MVVKSLRDTGPRLWCLQEVLPTHGNPCKCTSVIYNSVLRGSAGPQLFIRLLKLYFKSKAIQDGGLEAFVSEDQKLIQNFYHLRGKVGRTYPRFAGLASRSRRDRRLLRTLGETGRTSSEA